MVDDPHILVVVAYPAAAASITDVDLSDPWGKADERPRWSCWGNEVPFAVYDIVSQSPPDFYHKVEVFGPEDYIEPIVNSLKELVGMVMDVRKGKLGPDDKLDGLGIEVLY